MTDSPVGHAAWICNEIHAGTPSYALDVQGDHHMEYDISDSRATRRLEDI